MFRWEVIGVSNIPAKGGVVIAANHASLWDPPILGSAIASRRWPVHFMAKEELFKSTVLGYIITKLHAFPVRRGTADRVAIRTAINLLQAGEVVSLFPEGTRSKNGQLGPAQPGAAMIAVKAGVPIIPAAIIGTNKIFSNHNWLPKVKVVFGKPIGVPDKADKEALGQLSETTMERIAELINDSFK
jgi:1-acyl-sn-glycerol-3-phosphate acyltransferase